MALPLLYTAENEYPAAEIETFARWYAHRHAPDVYRAGFLSCASYRAVEGGLNILGIYEIPSTEIFETAAYRGIPMKDPYRDAVAGAITGRAHTVYSQRLLHPAVSKPPLLDADWLCLLRFDAEEAVEQELADFLGKGGLRAGPRRIRLARRSGQRPNSVSNRPPLLLVGEWPECPKSAAAAWELVTERFGDRLRERDLYLGQRAYPWPDRPVSG